MSKAAEVPRVFRMAGWVKVLTLIAMVLICSGGAYFLVWGSNPVYRAASGGLIIFGIAGFLDTMVSRVVLDVDAIHFVSLVRRRTYARSDFESAKVEGGAVVLKRRDGGWLAVPSTGTNALSMRNIVHAWIKAGQ